MTRLMACLLLLLPFSHTTDTQPALISEGKPASAASGADPGKANDGAATNDSAWGGYLRGEQNSWWQVDLQGTFDVSRIRIRNYVDGRYFNYYVRTSLDGRNWSTPIIAKAGASPATDAGDDYTVHAVARYVRVNITKSSANFYGFISDFKAWGTPTSTDTSVVAGNIRTTDTVRAGQDLRVTIPLRNTGRTTSTVPSVRLAASNLASPYVTINQDLAKDVRLAPGQSTVIRGTVKIPAPGAYGLFVKVGEVERYNTFVRVLGEEDLTTYRIGETSYRDFPIYHQDGGMSAEYAVEKSAEALRQTVTPTHDLSRPGYGPNPVWATPHFLREAVNETVGFYDRTLGARSRMDTVVIGPGVETMPYLSLAFKAPVLPSHFLASAATIQELETVLDTAKGDGMPSYTIFGPTGSMANGVAWIKMLGLPPAYKDFLRRHRVRNVIFLGTLGTTGGSNEDSKVISDSGDLWGGGTDWQNDNRFSDLPDHAVEPQRQKIIDWEDGMSQPEVDGIAAGLPRMRSVTQVSSQDSGIAMWDLAPYLALEQRRKNGLGAPKRVDLNPYLIAHPFYEATKDSIPFLFWEGFDAGESIDRRLGGNLRKALAAYYPDTDLAGLSFHLNTSRNFGHEANDGYTAAMRRLGLNDITVADPEVDEVWDPSDGMNSIVEKAAEDLASSGSHRDWVRYYQRMKPITLDDLRHLATLDPDISVRSVYSSAD